ncbi:hypothetical protein C8Q75DRAFT_192738 [Abortiporus biennis]|nr:hypothetical protein C8Q75DRAFT_192738 [Abortiporus biennis]
MDAHFYEHKANILEWDESDVHGWLCSLGFPQYEHQIREHHICGDVLCLLDQDSLKEIGITTIGQRLAILKAVYMLKLAHNLPIEADHYVPPSEAEERQEQLSVERLYDLLRDQGDRLRMLEDEHRRLNDNFHSCVEEISTMRSSQSKPSETDSPVTRQPSFKWANFVKPSRSPTKPVADTTTAATESPQPSPQRVEHEFNARAGSSSEKIRPQPYPLPPNAAVSYNNNQNPIATLNSQSHNMAPPPPKPQRQESSDNLKSFKVSLDDPAWKVLPAALKKYKIRDDDWQNYAMFICYGATGNRIERCLSYDEKPLLLFQRLKEAKKNPVFMLKHIKDIRSPIAVAQQKQAARKANSESSVKSPPLSSTTTNSIASVTSGASSATMVNHSSGQSDVGRVRPPKLQVNSHLGGAALGTPGLMTGVPGNGQSGWPEIMSPAVESKGHSEDLDSSKAQNHSSALDNSNAEGSQPTVLREIPPSTGVSYAVAIYPYMAEQEDEFDVVVGDTFIILSRARGWWVVQRDPAGSGNVEQDINKQGWVPAGCLLETKIPVATAIAEATATTKSNGGEISPTTPGGTRKTPILPLSILSTSFPGIALMDYKKKGEEELDLVKDDSLRVFKRYNHWSYAVKEETGDRGWVPSWFIGKVPNVPGVPPTPSSSGNHFNTSNGQANGSTTLPLDGSFAGPDPSSTSHQVSPMSSAFPPMSTRPTAVAT